MQPRYSTIRYCFILLFLYVMLSSGKFLFQVKRMHFVLSSPKWIDSFLRQIDRLLSFVLRFSILLRVFAFVGSFLFCFNFFRLLWVSTFILLQVLYVVVIFQFYFVASFCFCCEFSNLFCDFFCWFFFCQLWATAVARFGWKLESIHLNLEHFVLPSTLLIYGKEALYRIQKNKKRREIY